MKEIINSNVRHVITVGGGFLAAKGMTVSPESLDQASSGISGIIYAIVAYAIAIVWSFLEKKGVKGPA